MRQECEAGSMGVWVRFRGPGSKRPDCRCALIQQKHEEKQPFVVDRRHVNILLHKSNMTVLILGFSVRSRKSAVAHSDPIGGSFCSQRPNPQNISVTQYLKDSFKLLMGMSQSQVSTATACSGPIPRRQDTTALNATTDHNKISMNTSAWLAYLLYFN